MLLSKKLRIFLERKNRKIRFFLSKSIPNFNFVESFLQNNQNSLKINTTSCIYIWQILLLLEILYGI